MTSRHRWSWLLGAVALVAGLSLMVAAYGVAANRTKAAPKHPQAFGTLRAVLDTIDYLDPQLAYTGQSWWAMWNVWETLLTYKHVDGAAGHQLVTGGPVDVLVGQQRLPDVPHRPPALAGVRQLRIQVVDRVQHGPQGSEGLRVLRRCFRAVGRDAVRRNHQREPGDQGDCAQEPGPSVSTSHCTS